MIDPELAAVLDFCRSSTSTTRWPRVPRSRSCSSTMRTPLPEAELLEIEDRQIPGWEGDPEVPCGSTGPKDAARPGTPCRAS